MLYFRWKCGSFELNGIIWLFKAKYLVEMQVKHMVFLHQTHKSLKQHG